MKRLLLILMSLCLMGTAMANNSKRKKLSVLFIAGKDTHKWGTHDHNPGTAVLAESLKSALGKKVRIKVAWSTWPSQEDFDKADVAVVYSDGWNQSVLKGKERMDQVQNFMKKGKGVLRIHWATGSDPSENELHRNLFGGNMEAPYSVHSQVWNAKLELSKHPITRGMTSFELFDETYFFMRWNHNDEKKAGVKSVLTVNPGKGFRARWASNEARKSIKKGDTQTVAWTLEHANGGRTFSYTGGHSHWDWGNDNQRMLILNAILWSAGCKVPKEGLKSPRPTAEHLINLMLEKGKFKNPGWKAEKLQILIDKMNEPGGKVDWGRAPVR